VSWRSWPWRHRDALICLTLAVGFLAELLAYDDPDLSRSIPLAAAASAALWWRRTYPVPSFIVCWMALFGLAIVVNRFDNSSTTFVLAYFISIFSLGAHTRGKEVVAAVVLVLIAIATFGVTDGDGAQLGDIAFATFFVGGPWATGLALRLRGDLAESNARLKVEQEERTRRAVAEERATIARELHDVVSHAISVTVLQSRGARRMLGRDEGAVRRALDAIEHTNTQALGDMRRLLAVLRDTEGDAGTSPQPSLARLDDLVADVTESGLEVELRETGADRDVPPGVDLSAYRIIQESLTNVLKHSGAARATVSLQYEPDELLLSVRDDGRGAGEVNGQGHGLVGIRERVAVVGGEIETGPGPDGGFEVRARLPYSVES
jgi:signal transduction histidine kinase